MSIKKYFEGEKVSLLDLPSFMGGSKEKFTNQGKLTCLGYYRQGKEVYFFLPRSLKPTNNTGNDTLEGVHKNAAIWLYNSINRYRERIKTGIVKEEEGNVISTSIDDETKDTLLDHFLALEDFYYRNKDLILMIYKEAHRGYHRINWSKTVRQCTPIISVNANGRKNVAYMEVCNERLHIHDQEELMVLFFSTLNYIHQNFGYPMPRSEYYSLIGEYEFEDLVENNVICPRLKAIRQQYFNDRMQELWKLLYAFYSKLDKENDSKISDGNNNTEYLLATNFDRLFEDAIDYLISDPALSILKRHDDNRIIDHIFLGESLFGENSKVYYIADSKYYSPDNEIDRVSIAKQYDYARNIIQIIRDQVNEVKHYDCIDDKVAESYYNEKTHGYNVTPNFFIRPGDSNTDSFYFEHVKTEYVYQHKGRLFDRSTLFLLHYSINLNYVLEVYSKDDYQERTKIKREIEKRVKDDLRSFIEDNYYQEDNPRINVPDIAYKRPGVLFEIEDQLFMVYLKNIKEL